jgi:dCMP deaminase
MGVIHGRPGWDAYFMGITEAVAARADCTRRRASALVVKNHRIVSSGYNGAPSGQAGCLAGGCPRGQLTTDELASYTSYDSGPGRCVAVHAEANALLYADRSGTEGATLYTWSSLSRGEPCMGCWRLIMGAGVHRVVFQLGEALVAVLADEYEDILRDGGLDRIRA